MTVPKMIETRCSMQTKAAIKSCELRSSIKAKADGLHLIFWKIGVDFDGLRLNTAP